MISADSKTPKKLVKAELALADTQFIMQREIGAVVWLCKYSRQQSDVLKTGKYTHFSRRES